MPSYDTSRFSGIFERSNLRTSNLKAVLQKLENSSQDGAEKLCIMADFDFTITKRWSDEGKKLVCPSTYDVVKDSDLIDRRCAEMMKALFVKFWPIETDPHMSVEEKTPHISEWMSSEMRVMKEAGLTQDKLASMLKSHKLVLRERFPPFLTATSEAQVPFIISTAGLADVVEGALRGWNLFTGNVGIIGNRFSWDPENKSLLGVKGDFVHTLNKECSMKNFFVGPEPDATQGCDSDNGNNNRDDSRSENATLVDVHHPRPNIILLGDSLGDARMTNDLEFAANVIKIGFLNDVNPESRLDAFLSTFDIVLINDDSMEVPIALFEIICDTQV